MHQWELYQKARLHTQSKEWDAAAESWQQLTEDNPVNGEYWLQLGRAEYGRKNYRQAIAAYQKTLELKPTRSFVTAYDIACCYALLNETENALNWLEQSFALGFNNLAHAQVDEDLKLLHDDPRFKTLVALDEVNSLSRNDGLRYDLDLLVKQLKRVGYAPFRSITEPEFDAQVKKLHEDIPQLSDMQVTLGFARLLQLAGDGHTRMIRSPDREDLCLNTPLEYYIYEEGVFIIRADPQYEVLLGLQLIAMDGHPIQFVMEALYPIVSRDNDQWLNHMTPFFMRNPAILHALGIANQPDRITLTLLDAENIQKDVEVLPKNTGPIWYDKWFEGEWLVLPSVPRTMRQQHINYWFEYDETTNEAYIQFNSVQNMESETLPEFAERAFDWIEDHDIERLILDVRYNNGGNTYLHMPMVNRIIGSKRINRVGHLFVLIGRRTFSAAMNFVTLLDRHANPIFVGEPTGSSPNFVGEGVQTKLPYSQVNISTSDLYWQSSWPTDERIWIAPHIYVPPKFADVSSGRDATLELVKEIVSSRN